MGEAVARPRKSGLPTASQSKTVMVISGGWDLIKEGSPGISSSSKISVWSQVGERVFSCLSVDWL